MNPDYIIQMFSEPHTDGKRTQTRARVVSKHNGNIILGTTEGYNNYHDCRDIMEKIFPNFEFVDLL